MLYRDFRPTGFDSHIEVDNREDWLVVPCGRNRDSGCSAESNFHSALEILGGESETVEVHRFGHWGPGWFEIILAHPSLETQVQEIEASLADYSILDDSDLSERECEAEAQAWDSWGAKEVRKLLKDEFSLSETTADWFNDERLFALYQHYTSGTEHSDTEVHFPCSWMGPLSREKLAQWVRAYRKGERERPSEDS